MVLEHFRRKMKANHGLLENTMIIAVTSVLANMFNYIFYFYTARKLGPEQYSVFGALLSIYFIFFFLTNIMNYIVIQYVSYFRAKTQFDKIRRMFDLTTKSMTIVGFSIFLALVILSAPIRHFIKHDSIVPIVFLGLFIWAYVILATFFGMLNGNQKFRFLGAGRVTDGFFTLVFGAVFLRLFFAALLTIPFVIVPLKFLFSIQPARIGDVGILPYILKSIGLSLIIGIMLNIDVIMVKIFFTSLDAGYFAAASLMGKIIFFVSTGMLSVMFPKAAELHSNGEDSSPLLKDALTYTATIGFSITLLYLVFPNFFAHILFSADYKIANLIGLYALSTTFLALTNVFVMYNMAIKRFSTAFTLLPFAVLEIVVISVFRSSLFVVLSLMCLTMFLAFVSIVYFNQEEFLKMFRKTTGYRKYPVSAYLRLKTESDSNNNRHTSSRKIKMEELDEFLDLSDIPDKKE